MAVIDWLIPEHKAERAHTRNTAWSTNWQQFACALLLHSLPFLKLFFFFPPPTDYQLCCVTPSLHFSPHVPSLQLFQITIAPLPLSPLLCNCIWTSRAGPFTSRGHHSSVAYILVLHHHGHRASKQCHRRFFCKEIWTLVQTISAEPYRATIQTINHI